MAEPDNQTTSSKQNRPPGEVPMERRLLLAFVLMMAVLFLTPYIFKPSGKPPAPKPAPQSEAAKAEPAPVSQPPLKPSEPKAKPPAGQIAAEKEQTYVVDTSVYRVEFSNRGAVVRSWILKAYKDNGGRPIDLVNGSAVPKTGYPFSLAFPGRKPPVDLNQVLYAAKVSADGMSLDFEYSDGHAASRKTFHYRKDSYLSEVSSDVTVDGQTTPNLFAWRGGFGDRQVPGAAAAQHSVYFDVSANKLEVKPAKDAKDGPVSAEGTYSFAGIQDTYFAAVFLPGSGSTVRILTYSDSVATAPKGPEEPHVGAAVGDAAGNRFALFVGPKDIDKLRQINPKLEQLVDFGWFALIAKPLFLAVNWLNDRYVNNYGWSIVVVTIIINFLLLPLKFTSLKSMKKMQMLQPQIAAINERYKGIGLRDPRKSEQNQEVMGLYQKHGVNPMGGCIPMVLQIPFFFAFYKVLSVGIELRGASWLWVTDLSQPENLPIRILPIAMIASQFIMQKMTPSTTADPTQQKMMLMMPLVLGFMFYGVSSGLVLYWLTSNLVGIAQQWFFNRNMAGSIPAPVVSAKTKKGSRK